MNPLNRALVAICQKPVSDFGRWNRRAVRVLIALGANLNCNSHAPLKHAITEGNYDLAQMLITHGATIDPWALCEIIASNVARGGNPADLLRPIQPSFSQLFTIESNNSVFRAIPTNNQGSDIIRIHDNNRLARELADNLVVNIMMSHGHSSNALTVYRSSEIRQLDIVTPSLSFRVIITSDDNNLYLQVMPRSIAESMLNRNSVPDSSNIELILALRAMPSSDAELVQALRAMGASIPLNFNRHSVPDSSNIELVQALRAMPSIPLDFNRNSVPDSSNIELVQALRAMPSISFIPLDSIGRRDIDLDAQPNHNPDIEQLKQAREQMLAPLHAALQNVPNMELELLPNINKEEWLCPLSLELMVEPVRINNHPKVHVFEKTYLENVLNSSDNGNNPLNRQPFKAQDIINADDIKSSIAKAIQDDREFLENLRAAPSPSLLFSSQAASSLTTQSSANDQATSRVTHGLHH